jgi:hypothetical protein
MNKKPKKGLVAFVGSVEIEFNQLDLDCQWICGV